MSELITDAMVEAAAAASYDAGIFIYDMHCPVWTKLTPLERDEWLVGARAALEATAPVIAARSLRDAANAWQVGGWADDTPHGATRPAVVLGMARRATNWLRTRADRIERGES